MAKDKPGVSLDQKAELQRAGLWKVFWKKRQEIRDSGAKPSEAQEAAWAFIGPQFQAWKDGVAKGEVPVTPVPAPPVAADPQADAQLAGLSPHDRKAFMARRAEMVDVCNWVAGRLEAPDEWLAILDAPSAAAWGMLMDARRSAFRKAEFWDNYWKLLPSKARLGDDEKALSADGAAIVDAIAKLLVTRGNAEKTSVAAQAVARVDAGTLPPLAVGPVSKTGVREDADAEG